MYNYALSSYFKCEIYLAAELLTTMTQSISSNRFCLVRRDLMFMFAYLLLFCARNYHVDSIYISLNNKCDFLYKVLLFFLTHPYLAVDVKRHL